MGILILLMIFVIYVIGWILAYFVLSRFAIAVMFDDNYKWSDFDRKMCALLSLCSWFTVLVVGALLAVSAFSRMDWNRYNFTEKYVKPFLKWLEPNA
jgi:hypothetical protein